MSSISKEAIDGRILSFVRTNWLKVAMVISRVLLECRHEGNEINEHEVAERVVALVEIGKLEAQGNLSRWRHSEVRLPDQERASAGSDR
jgi:hypothetical protein